MTTQDLTIKLALKDEASKGMGKASKNIKGHAGKIKDNLGKIGTVGGAGLMAASAAALKLGDTFKEAENVIAAGTGATGKDLEDLKASFKDVFKDVPDDAKTVAAAIADVNTEFGFTGDKLESVAALALGAGRAMGEDMAGLIKATADTLIAFGEPAEDAEILLDKLTVASQASGVSMQGIADKVVKFGPQLNAMGLEMDEAIALITGMESAGLDAGKMMPGLSAAMKKLADEGVTDIQVGLQDAIAEIQNAESDTDALAKAMDTFGAGAGVIFKDAIDKGVFSLDEMLAAMGESDGTLLALSESTLTSAEKFDIFKNKAMAALEPIGAFASTAGPMLMVLPTLITLTSALSAAKVVNTAATWAQTVAMGALNIAMGPIGLIIIGITAAIAAAILIFKNWDTIVRVFKDTFKLVSTKIKELFDSKLGWILPFGILYKGIKWLKDNWKTIWDGMKKAFVTVVDAIKKVYDVGFGWITGNAFTDALFNLWAYWNKVWDGMKGTVQAIANPIISIINTVIGGINKMFSALRKVKMGWAEKKALGVTVLPGFSLKPFKGLRNISKIPSMAEGGIVTGPTLAQIGERGPEAVIPLGRGGAGLGVTVNINFPRRGTVILGDDMAARKLAQALTPLIRQALRGQPGFA